MYQSRLSAAVSKMSVAPAPAASSLINEAPAATPTMVD